MTTPPLSPVVHEIQVNVVSAEEASRGVAELWSGDRLIGAASRPSTEHTGKA
jgi:hypothetical protein